MFQPKPISRQGVAAALDKAHLYRMLNEPLEAESICLDVLAVEPDNKRASVTLILALTDQLELGPSEVRAQALRAIDALGDAYERAYYRGIAFERSAKARLRHAGMGAEAAAWDEFHEAMASYEKAIELRPGGNDDAILRWNTCARFLGSHPNVRPGVEEAGEHMLE